MTRGIKKVFVANRGEIAVRIVRAAHEMGMQTVVGCSDADADSLAARMAGEVVNIGPAAAAKSYLNIAGVVAAAVASGADAVHPGYGFLSENAGFAAAVVEAGLVFVGPSAQTIALMGDKARARACATQAGVPTVPGSIGVVKNVKAALEESVLIGFPIMLKAAAGGGGRGIRVAGNADELAAQYIAAKREAQSAFGDDGIYLERFVSHARHVEVQIIGDGQRVIHLYDRECSLQRRRQKLFEEAPAPSLNDSMREKLCACAASLAESVRYSGAGTLEFLFDATTEEFFFIEMNTRVQVEHPVTEMVTGIDIVRETLRIANGEPLRIRQQDVQLRGASLECRINAEDPTKDFRPSPGLVSKLSFPTGPGVRVDSMLFEGYKVSPFYDSLLAKVVVWDEDRPAALRCMKRALTELTLEGLPTTKALHLALLDDPGVVSASYHTNYLEEHLGAILKAIPRA